MSQPLLKSYFHRIWTMVTHMGTTGWEHSVKEWNENFHFLLRLDYNTNTYFFFWKLVIFWKLYSIIKIPVLECGRINAMISRDLFFNRFSQLGDFNPCSSIQKESNSGKGKVYSNLCQVQGEPLYSKICRKSTDFFHIC